MLTWSEWKASVWPFLHVLNRSFSRSRSSSTRICSYMCSYEALVRDDLKLAATPTMPRTSQGFERPFVLFVLEGRTSSAASLSLRKRIGGRTTGALPLDDAMKHWKENDVTLQECIVLGRMHMLARLLLGRRKKEERPRYPA